MNGCQHLKPKFIPRWSPRNHEVFNTAFDLFGKIFCPHPLILNVMLYWRFTTKNHILNLSVTSIFMNSSCLECTSASQTDMRENFKLGEMIKWHGKNDKISDKTVKEKRQNSAWGILCWKSSFVGFRESQHSSTFLIGDSTWFYVCVAFH